jgi:hypothetical protein
MIRHTFGLSFVIFVPRIGVSEGGQSSGLPHCPDRERNLGTEGCSCAPPPGDSALTTAKSFRLGLDDSRLKPILEEPRISTPAPIREPGAGMIKQLHEARLIEAEAIRLRVEVLIHNPLQIPVRQREACAFSISCGC